MEVTRELYNSMAEGDVDVALNALDVELARREDVKKNELKNSIEKINRGTTKEDSQMKAAAM